jgi:hypothetical protein
MLASSPTRTPEETNKSDELIEPTDDSPVRILTMTYRPYDLMGPILIGALLQPCVTQSLRASARSC